MVLPLSLKPQSSQTPKLNSGDKAVLSNFRIAQLQESGEWVCLFDGSPLKVEETNNIRLINDLIPAQEEKLPEYCQEMLAKFKEHIVINTISRNFFSDCDFFAEEFHRGIKFRIPVNSLEICIGASLLSNCSGALCYMFATDKLKYNIHLLKNDQLVGILLFEELAHWLVQNMPVKSSYTFVLKDSNSKDYSLAKKVASFFIGNPDKAEKLKQKVLDIDPSFGK